MNKITEISNKQKNMSIGVDIFKKSRYNYYKIVNKLLLIVIFGYKIHHTCWKLEVMTMNKFKKVVAVALSAVTVASVGVVGGSISVGASGTGAGLAEYALNAYYEGWSYVWGGTEPGAVDCSGLIWSYCGGDRLNMRDDAIANGRDWGYVSDGIPRVHGLGLSRPNHVGVYIEDGMEVDARGSDYGVCYQQIGENGYNNWDCWFKLTAVSYPENGWENFNGNYYYYENGEYVVNTSRTIDGTTYYFDSKGHSGTTPTSTSSSSSSSSDLGQGSSKSSGTTSKPTSWSKGSNDDEVIKIQERLAELGYYDGAIDGIFGDKTDAAFRAFQAAAGLTVDGIAGSDREVLYSDNAPAAKTEAPAPVEEEKTEEPAEQPAEQPATEAPAEETTAAEEENLDIIVIETGTFSDEVATVQAKLVELGYFGLEPTGLYGDFTTEAIANFQMANGLESTGLLDTTTYMLLFSDDAVVSEIPAVGAVAEEAPAEEVPAEEAAPEEPVVEEAAAVEEVAEPAADPIVESMTPVQSIASTAPAVKSSEYAATASNSVAKANEVTAKALEKSSNIVPTANTADVKRSANIWLWLILVAAILGIVAVVMLIVTKKQNGTRKQKKMSTRAKLNTRW